MKLVFGTLFRHLKQRIATLRGFNRTNPYFKWLMTFDAILSVCLVLGGIAIYSQTVGKTHQDFLKLYGAIALSAEDLTNVVRSQEIEAYWLGPISGSKYTIVKSEDGAVVITYLSGGQGILDNEQRKLIFQTESDNSRKGALLSNESRVTNAFDISVSGNTFSYDSLDPDHMLVKIKGSRSRVWVYYPTKRDAIRMEIDADALRRIY